MSTQFEEQFGQFLNLLQMHRNNIGVIVSRETLMHSHDLEGTYKQAQFLCDRFTDLQQRGVF